MNHPQREIVRIGASAGRIVTVTPRLIHYIDVAGQGQVIDLETCARSWGRWHDAHSREFLPLPGATDQSIRAWNARCVGQRDLSAEPPWVEFLNERNTRFEFGTYEAAYLELLGPLEKAGWQTFDLS